jgi:hypothetical protein
MCLEPGAVFLCPIQGVELVQEDLFDDEIAILENLHFYRVGPRVQHAPDVGCATTQAPEDPYTRVLVHGEAGHVVGDSFKSRLTWMGWDARTLVTFP